MFIFCWNFRPDPNPTSGAVWQVRSFVKRTMNHFIVKVAHRKVGEDWEDAGAVKCWGGSSSFTQKAPVIRSKLDRQKSVCRRGNRQCLLTEGEVISHCHNLPCLLRRSCMTSVDTVALSDSSPGVIFLSSSAKSEWGCTSHRGRCPLATSHDLYGQGILWRHILSLNFLLDPEGTCDSSPFTC